MPSTSGSDATTHRHSWTRYYRFEKKEATRPWSLLIHSGFDEFPYRLLYVDVGPNGAPAMRPFAERLHD